MNTRLLLSISAATVAIALLGTPLRAEQAVHSEPFTKDALLAALTRDLAAHYNTEGDLQLELLRPWTDPRPVAAGWTVIVLDYPLNPASSMLVRCRVRDGAGVALEEALPIHAALWRDAWVVRVPVAGGEVFDASKLDTRRSDMLRDGDLLPASVGDASYAFARAIPVGRMVTWHDVARLPLVRKGDQVVVTAVDGLLTVSMKALALENGALGETVTVRNTESHKEFTATVTDENHVQIQF
jgi:flagellar basal body P-ring formation protein FlgA